jgi:hypothetical protein
MLPRSNRFHRNAAVRKRCRSKCINSRVSASQLSDDSCSTSFDPLIVKIARNAVSHDGVGRFVMANFVYASSLWLAVLVVLLLGQHSSRAQELRFALVIGNDQYRTATLAPPANHAGLVADTLGAAGVRGYRQTRPSSRHRLHHRIRAAPVMNRAAFRPTHRQMQR